MLSLPLCEVRTQLLRERSREMEGEGQSDAQGDGRMAFREPLGFLPLPRQLGVHIPRPPAIRGVAGDVKERAGLLTRRTPVRNRNSLEHIPAILTLPLGHPPTLREDAIVCIPGNVYIVKHVGARFLVEFSFPLCHRSHGKSGLRMRWRPVGEGRFSLSEAPVLSYPAAAFGRKAGAASSLRAPFSKAS